jgi:isoleucyl-tRNA synthetase
LFETVPSDPQFVPGEHEILRLWAELDAFETLRRKNSGGPKWSFLDGPITANNPMGVHNAWGRTYKDAFQRYFAMTGHDQRWQNGFDCQGLWVEVEVERELSFRSKREIEEYGIGEFVQRCKDRVLKYAAIQTEQSIRLGMWMDWPASYFTMSDENNYTIWAFLKKCHERGLVYKGLDAMPWCPRCSTGISEQEQKEGYKTVEEDSVYVRLPIRGWDGEFLLVWTTTPWTLPANVAVAVHPDLPYARVRLDDRIYHLAEARLHVLAPDSSAVEVLSVGPGRDLENLEYDAPFDDLPAAPSDAHRVVLWGDVEETEGTGLVHIAPGCGKEDFDLAGVEGLPVIETIDEFGRYLPGYGALMGKSALEVAGEVTARLETGGFLFRLERYRHEYPHCWRCDTPLLFRAVDEWYIDMGWSDEIATAARTAQWVPDHLLELELDWLKNMGDWMISKKRYWGLALPIWECRSCGWFDVIGSREELEARAVAGWDEFVGDPSAPHSPHRPWVDAVTVECTRCGAAAHRIPDVGNPWLDAGIVPFSTTCYRTDRQYWAEWIPADFVVESFPGQFRNWFYALLAMSTMMEGISPFKTLFGHALVRNERGAEMHKSKGAAAFDIVADEVGADIVRWLFCRHNPTANINFGPSSLDIVRRQVFRTLWNTYLFFCNYALLDGFDPSAPRVPVRERPDIDRWLLGRLNELIDEANQGFRAYWIHPFMRKAEEFIDELSNWYVRLNRRRFWRHATGEDADKAAAYQTLYEVLVNLSVLLAPVIPFLTERMYQNLAVQGDPTGDHPRSVHHCSYPEAEGALADRELAEDMAVTQQVVSSALGLRTEAGHRVRQPLSELRLWGDEQVLRSLKRFEWLIREQLNVKRVSFEAAPADPDWVVRDTGTLRLGLNVALTPELRREGLARDMVRHIQTLRRSAGLAPEDRIWIDMNTEDPELVEVIATWSDHLRAETLCDDLDVVSPAEGQVVRLGGREMVVQLGPMPRPDGR